MSKNWKIWYGFQDFGKVSAKTIYKAVAIEILSTYLNFPRTGAAEKAMLSRCT